MKYISQENAPILEALEKMKSARLVPFDVPGHKRGRGNKELTDFLGERCLSVDVNSMKMLDNLCHPVSVIRDAEELAAEAFGAKHAFFMVGGTTSAVQAMVMTACKRGDKIIMPRNVHRSAINALILCGAVPVYVNPRMDPVLGISLPFQADVSFFLFYVIYLGLQLVLSWQVSARVQTTYAHFYLDRKSEFIQPADNK